MRWLGTLVTASLLSSHIQAAEQKPWKCVTVKSVGAKTTDGDVRSVSFADKPEFRVKPVGTWVEKLNTEVGYGRYLVKEIKEAREAATAGVSLFRKVTDNPERSSSWGVCRVYKTPFEGSNYSRFVCGPSLIAGLPELRFDEGTRRFVSIFFGDWHETMDGKKPDSDSRFGFGTCTPLHN